MNLKLQLSRLALGLCFVVMAACDRDERRQDHGSQAGHQEIHDFVDRYFQTWSDQKMADYRDLFLAEAVVHFMGEEGRLTTLERDDFIQTQVLGHQRSPEPMREIPLETTILDGADGRSVLVTVYWRLYRGDETETGYDQFTLVRRQGEWRIAYMLFYLDES